ncbi:MAG: hypothetical protein V4671_19655 [Armatimonadota bacterium]
MVLLDEENRLTVTIPESLFAMSGKHRFEFQQYWFIESFGPG